MTIPATTIPAATTTEVPATTEAPTTTTVSAAPGLPGPDDFLAQWNAATNGTRVPRISRSQITQIVNGPRSGSFLATLSPTSGNKLPPQVGLIGTLSPNDPTQITELLLVWIPGPDEAASDFFWQSFAVLARAVSPGVTADQIAALERSLGKADGSPPFPSGTNNTASRGGFDYRLFVGATREGLQATAISVT